MASDDGPQEIAALLLLPPPPAVKFEQFKDAYGPTLSTVFSKLCKTLNGVNSIAILDIAISIPGLLSRSSQPRAKIFPSLQHYLANIYRLIGIVSAEHSIELDAPGGIDARVIFIDFPTTSAEDRQTPRHGPILDLQSLANSSRLWDWIYYPGNEAGQQLATAFDSIYSKNKDPNAGSLHSLSNQPSWPSPKTLIVPEVKTQSPHYSVAVGGTFDHFHIGHKLLLTATALALEPVEEFDPIPERHLTVGVTGDALLKNKKYAEFLESWDDRCQSTSSFLLAIMDFSRPDKSAPRIERVSQPGPNGHYVLMKVRCGLTLKLVQITDAFGPTITDESIDALVVSAETRSGGAAVNDERAKKGWKSLDVFEIDVLHSGEVPTTDGESFASKISSTDIRRRRMEMATAQ
jgi:phosphopantetheine adenylyltransferase